MIEGHDKIALQFSGGKDSLVVVHLMRPYWERLTVYHMDTGDLLPEVMEIVDSVEAMVPSFIRIVGDSVGWMKLNGLPSDLVPTTCTPAGLAMGFGKTRIVDRFDCCASNIMAPLHYRMVADNIDLVIRGTKRADMPKLPAGNGPSGMGYDLWLPLETWSHDDVFAYLKRVGAPICRVYENNVNAPECATCPAWWSEKRKAYLEKHHPEIYQKYAEKLAIVAAEITPLYSALQVENG